MSRRPALITKAEVARAIRAAKEAGAAEVVIERDGAVRIILDPARRSDPDRAAPDLVPAGEIVL